MVPTKGSLVKLRGSAERQFGLVQGSDPRAPDLITVGWFHDKSQTKHHVAQLTSGLGPGMDVIHEASHQGGESLGQGRILSSRELGGGPQHLVDFWLRSERRWLPWQRLRPVKSVDRAFQGLPQKSGDAEALRLRNLAYALSEWDINTGGLTKLEIDPLPHQLFLVNKILASGDLNWMIADEVGLGKTIEVGLLLTALMKRRYRRFLIVCPAGLTRQWTEELREKFLLDDFVIYGDTANPETPAQWRLYDRVIVSMDRAKHANHLPNILQAANWDLVIVDEAHRLARYEYGYKTEMTERYAMAQSLRSRTTSMLLLSGTPHQGKDDLFRGLLELLRPGREWHERFVKLRLQPELISSMIIKNRKADVTDERGNFIFHGKTTKTVEVARPPEEVAFEQALIKYFKEGYAASTSVGGTAGLAIGFVMTTFRKLAASSLAAIEKSLARRVARLQGQALKQKMGKVPVGPDEVEIVLDERFVESDEQAILASGEVTEFFAGEIASLKSLVAMARALMPTDAKVCAFFKEVLSSILAQNRHQKVLIFTEYRTTQAVLIAGLEETFGAGCVSMVHGGQTLEERRAAVDGFNEARQFLVSTEAGGEGLNLHRKCNIMINFDLPWNPMRLVQRVGRLYRYGQKEPVVVFNIKTTETLDQEILSGMYQRLDEVAAAMAPVTAENREGLIEDILGQLVGALDVAAILDQAMTEDMGHSMESIEGAMRRAQAAVKDQDLLLKYASGFDPSVMEGRIQLRPGHLKAFVEAMLQSSGIEIVAKVHGDDVWDIKLSQQWQNRLGKKQNLRIAFDRAKARSFKGELLDGDHPLLRALLALAKDDPRGAAACIELPGIGLGYTALVRWLDESGRPVDSEYVCLMRTEGGDWLVNDDSWFAWLAEPAKDTTGGLQPSREDLEEIHAFISTHLVRHGPKEALPDSHYPVSGFVTP